MYEPPMPSTTTASISSWMPLATLKMRPSSDLLAVLFVRGQLFFRQPEESGVQRLLFGGDVTAVVLQPVGLDHFAAERRQLVSQAVDLILSDSEVGVDAAGGVKTQKAHIEISHSDSEVYSGRVTNPATLSKRPSFSRATVSQTTWDSKPPYG